jgi:hypothetical protein
MYFVSEHKMRQINQVLAIVVLTSSRLNTYGYNLINILFISVLPQSAKGLKIHVFKTGLALLIIYNSIIMLRRLPS